MKHAFLIIAHKNWDQLKLLLNTLDSEYADIFIHIDKRSNYGSDESLNDICKKSKVYIFSEYKVYWGGYSQVEVELFLLEKSSKLKYDYYHLLSGMDLPIKSKTEFYNFFQNNRGYEFLNFDEGMSRSAEVVRRTRLYHFLQNYRRRFRNSLFNKFFTFLERISLSVQIILGVNRLNGTDLVIKYGSNWFSITDDLVAEVLDFRNTIEKYFKYTNCADELFIQTIVYNSKNNYKIYNESNGNLRLYDFKRGSNGNPYVFKYSDYEELKNSSCLFARKFDLGIDEKIIHQLISSNGD